MANHEEKTYVDSVHLLMAFQRTKDGEAARCFRMVVKEYDVDLSTLEHKCKTIGGEWRIHHTVNARNTEKARLWLIHKLIDLPEKRGFVDSLWRTALLQKDCIYGAQRFMLDVDTNEHEKLHKFLELIKDVEVIKSIETPGGWHFITNPFDTRTVCELPYVTLLRDGYYFVKKIGESK